MLLISSSITIICVMISSTYEQVVLKTPDHQSNIMPSVCNTFDSRAPCQCKGILTIAKVMGESGKDVVVEFPEYVCEHKDDELRKAKGIIPQGHTCEQLTTKKILFRDQANQPIRVQIRYRGGCELRCVNDNCASPHIIGKDKKTKNFVAESENEKAMKTVRKRVEKLRNELMVGDICKIYSGVWKSFCRRIISQ